MEKSYDIFFAGQMVDGQDEAVVRKKLAALFKANDATLEKLFSGQPQLIKRGVDKATAARYRNAMHQSGAIALIKASAVAVPASPAPEPKPATSAPRETEDQSQTMAERLAALTGDAPADAAPPQSSSAPNPGALSEADESGLSLAPTGADVLRESERSAPEGVEVDTSGMEVDQSGADIPALPRFDEIPPAPDVSHLSMGEEGEDIPMLPSDLEPLDIDTSAIDLAPEGTDFSDCAPAPVAALEPDLSNVSLAPEGSDLLEEQYRKKENAQAPNVDHLQLSGDNPTP